MSESESDNLSVTLDAKPPFTFGIGLQGELIIGWVQAVLPDGSVLRAHLVVPAEEVKNLRGGLEDNKIIQETLAAKPPTQSSH